MLKIPLGKLASLFSSPNSTAKAARLANTIYHTMELKQEDILQKYPNAQGLILHDNFHTSRDPRKHANIDVYGTNDEPIGVVHVYEDSSIRMFEEPRTDATEVWKKSQEGQK